MWRTRRVPLGQEGPGDRNRGGSGAPTAGGEASAGPGAGGRWSHRTCQLGRWEGPAVGPERRSGVWPSLTSGRGRGTGTFGDGPGSPVGSRAACLPGGQAGAAPGRPWHQASAPVHCTPLTQKANLGRAGRKGLDLGNPPYDTVLGLRELPVPDTARRPGLRGCPGPGSGLGCLALQPRSPGPIRAGREGPGSGPEWGHRSFTLQRQTRGKPCPLHPEAE